MTLGFPSAPCLKHLTLPARAARRTVLQKVRGPALTAVPQLVNTGVQVLFHSPHGVLFTFPSQYSALSVTKEYLALRGGPRAFPQGFTCPVVLWIPPCRLPLRLRGFHPLRHAFPGHFCWGLRPFMRSEPRGARAPGWAPPVSLAAPSGITCLASLRSQAYCFLFLRLLRCFSSPGSRPCVMDSRMDGRGLPGRVSPFRHPRIFAYLQLPAAFRSLSRLSSALSAKASALCPYLLNLFPLSRLAWRYSGLPGSAPGLFCLVLGCFFDTWFWFIIRFSRYNVFEMIPAATCSPMPSPA